ncbi:MAG: hypothetical protein KJ971_06505 [Firmicutes bacterium]|nr:hypothetical protein [Bacillota bacterium]
MIVNKKAKIYSLYEISAILFYATMMMVMPIILVITYIFELDQTLNINTFIFWLIIFVFSLTLIGTIVLILKKDYLKRQVKPGYRSEYYYLVVISTFGLLGFIVFYDYLGGNRDYIANILVVLFAIIVFILIVLGRKFFNFDYMKKK